MRILIVDQCSGAKDVPDGTPSYDWETIQDHSREELLRRDGVPAIRAGELYDGRQQQLIGSAVDRLRQAGHTVNRVFVSAGFGVVDEDTELPPYDTTFNDLSSDTIDDRAATLEIHEALQDLVRNGEEYDIVFFPLGSDYYRASRIEDLLPAIDPETTVVLFNSEELAAAHDNVTSLPARTSEAKEHGTIVVALKGQYLLNFATHCEAGATVDIEADIIEFCTTEYTQQAGLEDYESDRE